MVSNQSVLIINISIITRYSNVVPFILDRGALKNDTKRHKTASQFARTQSKMQLIKVALTSRVPPSLLFFCSVNEL